ncbi:hypothetical protein LTR95_004508 [Oleoguttula sp. CCFEE 5521]
MWSTKILSLTGVSILFLIAPVLASSRLGTQCTQLQIPVAINAINYNITQPRVDSTVDWEGWIWDTTSWSYPNLTERIVGNIPVSKTFSIGGQLCVPVRGSKAGILQIATHGVGFDRRVLHPDVRPSGTGTSDKADAYTEVQLPAETEILLALTKQARAGQLMLYTADKRNKHHRAYTASKVVHEGHSFGSFITFDFVAKYGNLSDGAVVTGALINEHLGDGGPQIFGFQYAAERHHRKFADRPSGYVAQGDKGDVQRIFLNKRTFEPRLLQYAFDTGETTTGVELLGGAVALGQQAMKFIGPVQFFIGEFDYVLCGGDCKGYTLAAQQALFPAASDVSVYLQPKTGHGLSLSTNATAGYQVMFEYLGSHGL